MSLPPKGLEYKDVRKKLKTYDSVKKHNNTNMINSLLNQARLCEGDKAAQALSNELCKDINNHSNPRVGYSPNYGNSWDRIFNKSSE